MDLMDLMDLMDRLGGLRLRERYQDWVHGPFTEESQDHISVYKVTAAPAGRTWPRRPASR
jgi:hypothetical protein